MRDYMTAVAHRLRWLLTLCCRDNEVKTITLHTKPLSRVKIAKLELEIVSCREVAESAASPACEMARG